MKKSNIFAGFHVFKKDFSFFYKSLFLKYGVKILFFTTIFLIPYETVRVFFGPIPFSLSEVSFCMLLLMLFFGKYTFVSIDKRIIIGMFGIFLGVFTSLFVGTWFHSNTLCPLSENGMYHGIGILKSWFVFPLIEGVLIMGFLWCKKDAVRLVLLIPIILLPLGVFSLLMGVFGSGETYDGRWRGIYASPNMLSMTIAPVLVLIWSIIRIGPKKFPQYRRDQQLSLRKQRNLFFFGWGVLIACFSIVLFYTESYSAWIAALGGIFFIEINFFFHKSFSWKRLGIYGMFLVFISTFLVIYFSESPRLEGYFDPDSRSSFASRIMIWTAAGRMISDFPFFGIGPGNFQSCYLAYQQFFPPYLEWSVPEPHGIFPAFWLGGGVMAFLSFLFLIFLWMKRVLTSIFVAQKYSDFSVIPLLLIGITGAMITILLHGLFDTTYWRASLAFIFWIFFSMGWVFSDERFHKTNKNDIA